MKLVLRCLPGDSYHGCLHCAARQFGRLCVESYPASNPVYAAVRAMYPDAQDCYECMRLWIREHGGLAYPENGRDSLNYYWTLAEHSTLEG